MTGWKRDGININSETSFNNFSIRKNSEAGGAESEKKLEFGNDYFPRHKSIVKSKYVTNSNKGSSPFIKGTSVTHRSKDKVSFSYNQSTESNV